MAGGSGTRLWPLSRAGYPEAVPGAVRQREPVPARRPPPGCAGLAAVRRWPAPASSATRSTASWCWTSCARLGLEPSSVLLEPSGRNTAPALTLAALAALEGGNDPVLVVTPADQTVTDPAAFTAALQDAVRIAAEGAIAILGITPDRPETGYGYIRTASDAAACKPWRSSSRSPLPRNRPALPGRGRLLLEQRHVRAARQRLDEGAGTLPSPTSPPPRAPPGTRARPTPSSCVPARPEFAAVPSESVDYAVMERCPGTDIAICAWSRWTPAGTTWAPGRRSGRSPTRTPTATPPSATRCSPTARTRWCTPPAAWSASSA